jgi:hypothetical protein
MATTVIVEGDAAYGFQENVKMVQQRDAADTAPGAAEHQHSALLRKGGALAAVNDKHTATSRNTSKEVTMKYTAPISTCEV